MPLPSRSIRWSVATGVTLHSTKRFARVDTNAIPLSGSQHGLNS